DAAGAGDDLALGDHVAGAAGGGDALGFAGGRRAGGQERDPAGADVERVAVADAVGEARPGAGRFGDGDGDGGVVLGDDEAGGGVEVGGQPPQGGAGEVDQAGPDPL